MTDQSDCTVLMAKQQAAVTFREELLRRCHFVLSRIETQKTRVRDEFTAVAEKETLAVVAASWASNPNYAECADPRAHQLGQELRVLTAAGEYIRSVEIPGAERRLQAERDLLSELVEIDREYLMLATETVN